MEMIPTTQDGLKAVLFDFDGTLTLPGALDFPAIRMALGCPADQPILEYIELIEDVSDRQAAVDRLEAIEVSAAALSQPNEGAQDVIHWLKRRQVATGIITRNSRRSVLRALENFDAVAAPDFDVIITRDDPVRPKPSGDGVLMAAALLRLRPEQVLMVGDFIYDCQAGRAAGAPTVLLAPFDDPRLQAADCDRRIRRLMDLKSIFR